MRNIAVILVLGCLGTTLAHAQNASARASVVQSYSAMCKKEGIKVPAEYGGDADIKNHPKLNNYCDCFAEKFADRALKTSEEVKKKGEVALRNASPEKTLAEDHEMRKTCRAQFGMPAPILPK